MGVIVLVGDVVRAGWRDGAGHAAVCAYAGRLRPGAFREYCSRAEVGIIADSKQPCNKTTRRLFIADIIVNISYNRVVIAIVDNQRALADPYHGPAPHMERPQPDLQSGGRFLWLSGRPPLLPLPPQGLSTGTSLSPLRYSDRQRMPARSEGYQGARANLRTRRSPDARQHNRQLPKGSSYGIPTSPAFFASTRYSGTISTVAAAGVCRHRSDHRSCRPRTAS